MLGPQRASLVMTVILFIGCISRWAQPGTKSAKVSCISVVNREQRGWYDYIPESHVEALAKPFQRVERWVAPDETGTDRISFGHPDRNRIQVVVGWQRTS